MNEIIFVTHNKGKIESAKKILKDVNFKVFKYNLEEPRSDDIQYISEQKVLEAYSLVKTPCISLDCGFWIDELNGFPKAFVNFTLETIGIEGILKLMENNKNRKCRFTECLSYYDGKEIYQFMGTHPGTLSNKILGRDTKRKWSDLWYIFIPDGYGKTLAEMTDEERDNRKKYNCTDAMNEFAKWYKEKHLELKDRFKCKALMGNYCYRWHMNGCKGSSCKQWWCGFCIDASINPKIEDSICTKCSQFDFKKNNYIED